MSRPNPDRRNPRDRGMFRRKGKEESRTRQPNRSEQSGLGGEQIEGRRAVYELLAAGRRRVREVFVSESLDENELIGEIERLAEECHTPLRRVSRARIDQLKRSDAPQGVIARAAPLREYTLDELLDAKNPFLLIVDGVTDPHNVGALLRTAECAGVTGVVLPRHRGAHVTPTVAKASAGAVEHMPIALVAGIPSALSDMKAKEIWTVGLDPDGDTSIYEVAVADQPIAVVVGAEGRGLSRLVQQRCDVLARIDQYGTVASLNVSAAGAISLFAIANRRHLHQV